jgi:hypothetical protein
MNITLLSGGCLQSVIGHCFIVGREIKNKEIKVVPVHAIVTCMGSTVPLILNLTTVKTWPTYAQKRDIKKVNLSLPTP